METLKIPAQFNLNEILEAIKQLSPKDRLKVNDVIWNEETEIPVEHQKLVLNRMAKSKKNPERLLSWDDIAKEL